MALTRSSFKCCISDLSLIIEESINIKDKLISLPLWNSWSLKYGSAMMPDGFMLENQTSLPKNVLLRRQQDFFIEQFGLVSMNIISASLNSDDNECAKLLRYLKVLVCWSLKFDARLGIEKLNEQLNNYQELLSDGAVPLLDNADNAMQSILVIIFNGLSLNEIIVAIDEIYVGTPRYGSDSTIWQYSILSNGVISSSQEFLQDGRY
jgi:hypothetical protein